MKEITKCELLMIAGLVLLFGSISAHMIILAYEPQLMNYEMSNLLGFAFLTGLIVTLVKLFDAFK